MTAPGIYAAKAVRPYEQGACWVVIPQLFGDVHVEVRKFAATDLPLLNERGWVMFEGGVEEIPVWINSDTSIAIAPRQNHLAGHAYAEVAVATGEAFTLPSALPIYSGGTGGTTIDSARSSLGITRKNLLHNGAMRVAQRNPTGSVGGPYTTSGYSSVDRWLLGLGTFGAFTLAQILDSPGGAGALFRRSIKFQCSTANASPAAGSYLSIEQRIEGQNCQAIMKGSSTAKPLTVSFWFYAAKAGNPTFICELYDFDNDRSCSIPFTCTSYTWQRWVLTFPPDTAGVLDDDINTSLSLTFWFGAGTVYNTGSISTLQTAWAATVPANRAAGCSNLAATLNDSIQMTGLQLEIGRGATDYEFLSFGEELRLCQRYYEKSYPYGVIVGANDQNGCAYAWCFDTGTNTRVMLVGVDYKVTKRSVGTIISYSPTGTAHAFSPYNNYGSLNPINAWNNPSDKSIGCWGTMNAAVASTAPLMFQWTVSADL